MQGGTVGEVVEPPAKFQPWATRWWLGRLAGVQRSPADQPGVLRKVDTHARAVSHYLGAVGMPGVTAWYGLNKIIQPKAGQTVVVSAASGAVGGALGALAKARSCRAVGIAGGPTSAAT